MRKISQEFLDAVRNEDVSKVESLLDHRVDVNFKDFCHALLGLTYEKFTFHYQDKHKDIAKLLLRYGAEFDIEDFHVKKLLDHSFEYKDTEVIELFLKGGIDPNTRLNSINNETLLHNASIHIYTTHGENQIKTMELLLKYGANPNAKDSYGSTPLHYCDVMLDIKRVELLLKYGADPNAKNNDDNTSISNMLVVPHLFQGDYLKGDVLFVLLAYGAALNDDDRSKINGRPNLNDCLVAFEQIKAMSCLGKLIEANIRRDKEKSAKIVSKYVKNEAERQELIKEFKTIEEKYGSGEQLSFISKCLLDFVKHISKQYLSEYKKNAFKTRALAGIIEAAVLSKQNKDISLMNDLEIKDYGINDKNIPNLRLVCKRANDDVSAYYKKCEIEVESLLTQLKKIEPLAELQHVEV